MAEATEAEEEKKLEPSCKVKEVGPCKFQLSISVTKEKVQEKIDDKYQELNDSVALPGFRKGHAPRNLLERKFGKGVLDDVKAELLHHSFEEAREAKKLEPVGEPDIDVEKIKVEVGKPFAYEVTIEVQPEFEVKDYKGLSVKKVAVDVDKKEIDAVIENFRQSRAELVPVKGKASKGDQVVGDFTLSADGNEVDKAENLAVFLTEDVSFYGMPLPDYHKAVVGKKAGDTVEFKATLPKDFADKKYAGKEATITTAIKSVKEKKLPEVNAEFAKAFDMDSVEEFREHVEKRITREKEGAARSAMANELVAALVKKHDFPMPQGLVSSGAEEAMQRLRMDLTMKGTPEDEIAKTMEKETKTSKGEMEKSLRSHFILEAIAKAEKIFVTEDQIEERIAQLAQQYGRWPHEMKEQLEQQGLLRQLRRNMREDAVREFLLDHAVITEGKEKGKAKAKSEEKKK